MVRKSLRQMTKANSANLTIIAKKKDDFLKLAVPKRLTLSKSQMKVEMILELNEQPKRLKKNLKKKKKKERKKRNVAKQTKVMAKDKRHLRE